MSQPFARTSLLYSASRALCRIGTTALLDFKAYGVEHVPPAGGVLLLSNHQSFLDPVVVAVQLRRPVSFLAKSELFENPVLARVITQFNAYPVRQGAGDVGAVRETIRRLKEGHVLTVFPEGSRSDRGGMLPLQGGFALVVRKAGVPIIPVALDGTWRALPKGSTAFTPARVRVMYGPPMDVAALKPTDIVAAVDRKLRGQLADLRRRDAADRLRSVS